MRITLFRFRHYQEEKSFVFPLHQLTLLQGSSGTGKSTLFAAIMWAIHGSMNKIYPWDGSSTSSQPTRVCLEFPELGGLVIRRTRPPETIEISLPAEEGKAKVQVGDAAQSYLDHLFGSKGLWSASSYIFQNNRCPLITLSSSEKFQLLHELTFGQSSQVETENPEYYLLKVETALQQVKQHLATESGRFKGFLEVYTQTSQSYRPAFLLWGDRPKDSVTVETITEQGKQMTVNLQEQKETLTTVQQAEQAYQAYTQKLATARQQLSACGVLPTSEELEVEEKRIREAQQAQEIIKNRTQILAQITALQTERDHLKIDPSYLLPSRETLEKEKLLYHRFQQLHLEPDQLTTEKQRLGEQLVEQQGLRKQEETWQTEVRTLEEHRQLRFETAMAEYKARCDQIHLQHQMEEKERQNAVLTQERYTLQLREYTRLLEAHRLREQLITRQADLEGETRKTSWASAEAIRQSIQERQLCLQELLCPHCSGGIRYHKDHLEKGRLDGAARDALVLEVKELERLVPLFEQLQQIRQEIAKLPLLLPEQAPVEPEIKIPSVQKLEMPVCPVVTPAKLPLRPTHPYLPSAHQKIEIRRQQLGELTIPGLSKEEVEKGLHHLEKVPLYDQINKQLEELQGRLPLEVPLVTEAQIKAWAVSYYRQKELLMEASLLRKTLLQLEAEAVTPASASSEALVASIDQLTKEIQVNQQLVQMGTAVLALEQQRVQLETMQQQFLQYAAYEGHLVQLKTFINEVATSAMEEIVTAINTTTNLILQELFEEEIRVVLRTHRELKTKEKTKLQVNLQIFYHGSQCDNPNELSGGELDRISLALTLALAKINPSPILLLDECIQSVGEKQKERCLKVIRQHLHHKTIVHICHEIVEGQHDHVVRM